MRTAVRENVPAAEKRQMFDGGVRFIIHAKPQKRHIQISRVNYCTFECQSGIVRINGNLSRGGLAKRSVNFDNGL